MADTVAGPGLVSHTSSFAHTKEKTCTEEWLQAIGLDLGDIVQMQAFLAGDPAMGGRMDLDGWNDAYRQ
jgi:hypothetical protein